MCVCQAAHWSTVLTEDRWDPFFSCIEAGNESLRGFAIIKKTNILSSVCIVLVFLCSSLCECVFVCVCGTTA